MPSTGYTTATMKRSRSRKIFTVVTVMFFTCLVSQFYMLHSAHVFCVSDGKEYALKLIEGTGISMSACREIAVSITVTRHAVLHDAILKMHICIY